ncbi:hypothetical protein H4R33_006000 [Dimargaris cristalligena]|nr:hypothetical protein H4R33_006000 [Dimargaris cristalligena]
MLAKGFTGLEFYLTVGQIVEFAKNETPNESKWGKIISIDEKNGTLKIADFKGVEGTYASSDILVRITCAALGS